MFVYYFVCRYYRLNYILKARAWAQALGFRMLQAQPKPDSSPPVGWAGPGSNGPGLGGLWALGPAQHITSCDGVWSVRDTRLEGGRELTVVNGEELVECAALWVRKRTWHKCGRRADENKVSPPWLTRRPKRVIRLMMIAQDSGPTKSSGMTSASAMLWEFRLLLLYLSPIWLVAGSHIINQEESTIGVLDTMPSGHPPKIARVASECQESRSILTKFANRRTLYQALSNEIIWYWYRYLNVIM